MWNVGDVCTCCWWMRGGVGVLWGEGSLKTTPPNDGTLSARCCREEQVRRGIQEIAARCGPWAMRCGSKQTKTCHEHFYGHSNSRNHQGSYFLSLASFLPKKTSTGTRAAASCDSSSENDDEPQHSKVDTGSHLVLTQTQLWEIHIHALIYMYRRRLGPQDRNKRSTWTFFWHLSKSRIKMKMWE